MRTDQLAPVTSFVSVLNTKAFFAMAAILFIYRWLKYSLKWLPTHEVKQDNNNLNGHHAFPTLLKDRQNTLIPTQCLRYLLTKVSYLQFASNVCSLSPNHGPLVVIAF